MIFQYKILYLTILLLLCICCACNSQPATSTDKANIIKEVLQSSDFQNFFHPNIENRTPLYLLDNENISQEDVESLEIDFEIKLVDDTVTINNNWIKITSLNIKDDKAHFELYYKIENMYMSGVLKKEKNKWSISKIKEVIEF